MFLLIGQNIADGCFQFSGGHKLLIQIHLTHHVVVVSHCLHDFLPHLHHVVMLLGVLGDFGFLDLFAVFPIEKNLFQFDQVNDPFEGVSVSDWVLKDQGLYS